MLRALVYLRARSLQNWLAWRLRRLRQPKYLFGAIVGVAYFYFFFFRRLGPGHAAHSGMPLAAMPADGTMLAVASLALFVVLVLMWVLPTERGALGFTEAEIAFLFPAPIGRRALIHFRLLSAQMRSLAAGLVMALVSNRWSFAGGNALTHAIGWWFVFATLNLHFTGAKFCLTRMEDRGLNLWLRRGLMLTVAVAVVGLTIWQLPAPARAGTAVTVVTRAFSDWVVSLAGTPPLGWVIYPLRLVVGPFLAGDVGLFVRTLAPALGVIALHYIWVVNTVVSFEEASIDQAEKRAARLAAWKSGDRRLSAAPAKRQKETFPLQGAGRPEIAFLWKNLLSAWPYFTIRVFIRVALVLVLASFWIRTHPGWVHPTVLALGAAIAGGYILVLGPQFARQDIRGDLKKVDILKTYPLAGWQIVLGELLTPVVILTGLVWLAWLVVVLNAFVPVGPAWMTPAVRIAGGLGAAIVVPAVVMLQVLVPNTAALLFPGWFEAVRARGGGPEVMGQRMIFFFAQILTIIVALLPAATMAVVLIWVLHHFVALPTALVVATGPVVAVLLAEIAGALWWLGHRFERIDVAEELRS